MANDYKDNGAITLLILLTMRNVQVDSQIFQCNQVLYLIRVVQATLISCFIVQSHPFAS